jgi:ATP-dependent DNA helicase RecQ
MEAYYQEIGRAGRDGLPAEAHLLYGLNDIVMRRMFIDQEDSADDHKRREHKRLDALIAFCEAPVCRRRALLSYFGEDSEECGNCDVCLDPPQLADGGEVGRAALAAVIASGQRFGAVHIIDILRGSENEKIRGFGHDRLACHGVGRETPKDAWRSILRQLVAAGYLALDVAGHGGLSLTPKGHGLVKGEEDFRYRKDTRPAKREKAPRGKAAKVAVAALAPADNALFGALKEQRLNLAQARGVPAYVIFSDRSLADMAARRPRDETAFAEVHGVGAAKLRDLAAPFLAIIESFAEEAS